MKHQARPLRFIENEDGCYIPLSHALNHDGYFRKRWGTEMEMFHRFVWRATYGDIPEGYEINHLCGCRACSNIKHLECIPGKEHTVKTNEERYVDRQNMMIRLIEEGKTAKEMMEITGDSRDAVYQYRSRYNKGKLPVLRQKAAKYVEQH